MGRATITSAQGEGLYWVEIDYGQEIIAAKVAAIDERIEARQERLDEVSGSVDAAQADVDHARDDVDAAIDAYQAAVQAGAEGDQSAITSASTRLIRLNGALQVLRFEQNGLKIEIASLQADKQELQNVRSTDIRQAWCADYTTAASGEVATAEIPDEPQNVIIVPGARGPTASDGRVIARGAQQGHQAYYNAAILPGVQRWRPQYRVGTITAIDKEADICNIQLQGEDSSAQSLIVDPPSMQYTFSNVPISYMDCNAEAFENGDRVLLQFADRDWSSPTVIGFESNPRDCTEEDEVQQYVVEYLAMTGLEIIGDSSQVVDRGGSTSPVQVVSSDSDLVFSAWDDGVTDNPRSDNNIQNNLSVTANGVRFPPYLELQPYDGPSVSFGSGGRPWSVSGDLATGETTTWSGFNCSSEGVSAGFFAVCRTVFGRWRSYGGRDLNEFESLEDVVLHATPNCQLGGSPGTNIAESYSVAAPGAWGYRDTNCTMSEITCEGPDIIPGTYSSCTGSELKISSDDFEWFYSRVNTPASVVLVHAETGISRTYFKAEVWRRDQHYRP